MTNKSQSVVPKPKHIKQSLVPLTPAFVRKFHNLSMGPFDRKWKEDRARKLRTKLENGLFHGPEWAIVLILSLKTKCRINGMHTSTILVEYIGKPAFPSHLKAHYTEYVCKDVAEANELFMQYDPMFSARGPQDVHGVYLRSSDDTKDLPEGRSSTSTQGIARYKRLVDGAGKFDLEDRARLILEYPEFIAWSCGMFGRRYLAKSGVCAAMFATFLVAPELVGSFWVHVRDETAPQGDATRTLADFLRNNSASERASRVWTVRAFYVKSINAWNAWIRNKSTSLNYYAKSKLPTPLGKSSWVSR